MIYYKFIYSKYFLGIASSPIELSFSTKENIPFTLNVNYMKGNLVSFDDNQYNFLKKILEQFYADFVVDMNWFEIVDIYVKEI